MLESTWDAYLELHPFALAQIDRASAIERINSKAAMLWSRRPDMFRNAGGQFALADGKARQLLARRLNEDGSRAHQFTVRLSDPVGSASHWLLVRRLPTPPTASSPIVPPALPVVDSSTPRFLISFRMADDLSRLLDPVRLSADLGLTPTEARLAAALADGSTLAEFARDEPMSVSTAKWHRTNILRKLGCSSQKDLVRTVLMVSL